MANLLWRFRYWLEGVRLVLFHGLTWEELEYDEQQEEEINRLLGFKDGTD